MKTFVIDYHLNDQTTFLHHPIQVCSAHAQKLALGYKNELSALYVHGLVIFQHRAQIQNLWVSLEAISGERSKSHVTFSLVITENGLATSMPNYK